ncbi:MAG: hypothetical protein CVU57_06580 [Deltaproteobacteria bacterium HGW-Deltaproteobacteria-15]|jgi:hypothetical protein|nr:MAG: hypothetical protein CVU57_06580 [Deltaproteobacteria bacterium HGW-Deltaproteobacteria-15]
MKKILIGLVAAMCCFALAAPAMAQVKISGMITLDAFFQDVDGERQFGGVPSNTVNFDRNDRQQTNINLPQALNRFDVQWTSEDKKVHGRIQLRYGAPTGGGPGTVQGFDPEFAYIDYHWTPGWYTRFGRQEQTFAIMAPSQSLGQSAAHIVGAGWGNVHGGTARDGIKNFFKFSDMVRLEVELIDPSNNTAEAVAFFPADPGVGGFQVVEENSVIPRIDLALNIKIANFVIEPSVTWLTQEYDGVAPGSEDTVDIWGAALGVAAGFGPVTVRGEVTYGENLGNANYVGGNGAAIGYIDANGDLQIEDTEVLAAWIDLGFNFGPAEIHGIVGYQQWETDAVGIVIPGQGERERERWMYGVNLPIKMTKNFTIKPEVMFYKDDNKAQIGRIDDVTADFGDELIAGVQFQLVF